MSEQPAAQDPDALPPELQAAVDAALHPEVPLHWVDADLVEGLTARATGFDPSYNPPAPHRVTDEEIDRALEQWQRAVNALFVLRLRSDR